MIKDKKACEVLEKEHQYSLTLNFKETNAIEQKNNQSIECLIDVLPEEDCEIIIVFKGELNNENVFNKSKKFELTSRGNWQKIQHEFPIDFKIPENTNISLFWYIPHEKRVFTANSLMKRKFSIKMPEANLAFQAPKKISLSDTVFKPIIDIKREFFTVKDKRNCEALQKGHEYSLTYHEDFSNYKGDHKIQSFECSLEALPTVNCDIVLVFEGKSKGKSIFYKTKEMKLSANKWQTLKHNFSIDFEITDQTKIALYWFIPHEEKVFIHDNTMIKNYSLEEKTPIN